MKKTIRSKKEKPTDIIARTVARIDETVTRMETNMATKDDIYQIRREMATKDGLAELEQKLIDDTGAVSGTEQRHFRSLTQRVARLEKTVFPIQ